MKGLYKVSTALSLIAALGSPAFATSTSTASVTDATVSLISLVGGSTSISFGTPSAYITGSLTDNTNSLTPSFYSSPTPNGSDSISTPLTSESSSISTTGGSAFPNNVSATGSATGGGTTTNSYTGYAYVESVPFTLSANTIAIFSSTGTASASTTQVGDYAYAYADLETYNISGNRTSLDNIYLVSSGVNGTGQSQTSSLDVSLTNLTNAPITGYLYEYAEVYGYSVSAVPEPATVALMGVGLLGLLGVVRSQRRRSSRAHAIAWA